MDQALLNHSYPDVSSIEFINISACRLPKSTTVKHLKGALEYFQTILEAPTTDSPTVNGQLLELREAGFALPTLECFRVIPDSSWDNSDVESFLRSYFGDLGIDYTPPAF